MAKAEEQLVNRRRGWWIRVARERLAMNVDDLAKRVGYSDGKGQVSKWENGISAVPAGKFPKIARVLRLPYAYLVNPPATDAERLDAAIQSASDAERRDWESEVGLYPGAADEPDASPGRRSA
jgi:transcriptional regulator with XRE-family HTH domain